MKIIILLGLLIVSTFGDCIIDKGIRITPKTYKDPFKYVICNEQCGDLCGSEGCSSLTHIFGSTDESSMNCCGSYIKRTCIVNDQILTGCYDDGVHKLPVTYCDETNKDGPCIIRDTDYKTCGFEEEDKKNFGIDQTTTTTKPPTTKPPTMKEHRTNKLTTGEIIWIGVGCFLFAIIVFFSISFLCYKYRREDDNDNENSENENSENDIEEPR